MRSRYYIPEWGRFLNADDAQVLELSQDDISAANLFAYCENDPVDNVDPSGHFVIADDIAIATFLIFALCTCIFTAAFGAILVNYISTTLPRLNLPKVNMTTFPLFDKAIALAKNLFYTIAKSIATSTSIARTKVKENYNYQYFAASLVNKKIVIERGMTYSQAKARVSVGRDVLCVKREAAYAIVSGYRSFVGPERSGGEGFLWHYHPNRASKNHIWYY